MLALALAALFLVLAFFAWRAVRIGRQTREKRSSIEQDAWAFAEQVRWEHYELERSFE